MVQSAKMINRVLEVGQHEAFAPAGPATPEIQRISPQMHATLHQGLVRRQVLFQQVRVTRISHRSRFFLLVHSIWLLQPTVRTPPTMISQNFIFSLVVPPS
jgi:hypothetical protein